MKRGRGTRVAGAVMLVLGTGVLPAVPSVAHPAPARVAAARTVKILIKPNGILNGFTPKRLTIGRGTNVVVVNHDRMRHTMTSRAKNARGNPLFSTAIAPGRSAVIKGVNRLAAGTYAFYCAIHPNMRGVLVVRGKPGGTKATGTTFALPLTVPRQLTGSAISIPVGYSRVRMLPRGPLTPIWTYGGTYPGPTIRRAAGRPTAVTFTDRLAPYTGALTVHLHGDHHSSADDGQPAGQTGTQSNQLLTPGHSRTYHYALSDSATGSPARGGFDFYHDHAMGHTARNNWNGLQGMFLVGSPVERALGLPGGRFDVPLMISDRSFARNNQLVSFHPAGTPPNDTTIGNHVLVNGRYAPYLRVTTHRYRFRLLNSSTYQSYDFALSNGRRFRQIGTGNGLLPHAVMRPDIILGPAQRADVIVDFHGAAGRNIVLRSIASTDHAPGSVGTPSTPIMQFRVGRRTADNSKAPYHLQAVPPITVPSTSTQTWAFGLGGSAATGAYWTVNGQAYDPTQVQHVVTLGSTELWTLRNDTNVTHYIHLHEEQWHTIARIDADGTRHAPPPWEQGLEDTWRLDPGAAVEVAATFTDYPGVFMIHCHMLNHEDDGMMAQFAVVDPQNPTLPAGFHYRPPSAGNGSPAPAGATGTGGMDGTHGMDGMDGMDGMSSMAARPAVAQHAARLARVRSTPVAVRAPVTQPPVWYATLLRLGRSIGVEAGLALLVLCVLRLRRRRSRGSPT